MIACVVLLVLVVGLIQFTGDRLARLVDHR